MGWINSVNVKSKYNAQKVTYDGIKFDSKKEGRRYLDLKLLQKSGQISDLTLQVPYQLTPSIYYDYDYREFVLVKRIGNNSCCMQRSTKYIADFVYKENNKIITEDCKGFRTKTYKKKANQMKKLYGIIILET